jgi:calcium-independent phospholipase A2
MAEKKSTKGGRLLCLDGGGIRGLILAVVLLELEKELGCPVIQCFEWVAGTSTGGILTLGLATGLVSSIEPWLAACISLTVQ